MPIIKLTVCFHYETDEQRSELTNWYRWGEQEHYFNSNCISHFKECRHATKDMQKMTQNKENFNTLMWLSGEESFYRIKETPEQILQKIKEITNAA